MKINIFCAYCRVQIKPGDARWTGLEPLEYWHYTCAVDVGVASQGRELKDLLNKSLKTPDQ